MSDLFHRSVRVPPPVAVSAQGSIIVGADGRRYLDACGGAAVTCLGHGHPVVIEAIERQTRRLTYAHTGFFSSEPAEELGTLLASDAPASGTRIYLVGSGSEAVEAAIKMAHQFHVENGEPGRHRVIGRWQSYHGNTLGALSAGGSRARRRLYEGLLVETHHVAPCYAYRGKLAGESDEAYGLRLAGELEHTILRLGAETVSAFVAETVVGATLGAVTPVPGYLRHMRDVCDRHGVLLILDEVMCGMGRTGVMHACMAEGVAPDLMTVAKGLGGGYLPLGAVFASGRVVDAFVRGSGAFQHGQTFLAHPLACAAALAVQRHVREENLVATVRTRGEMLMSLLRDRFGAHPHVGDIRGRGLLVAMELVADRENNAPFPAAMRVAARLKEEAQQRGLLCYPTAGTVDGTLGDHVLLAPAYTIKPAQLEEIVEGLDRALAATLG